jgi:hypothetical protein
MLLIDACLVSGRTGWIDGNLAMMPFDRSSSFCTSRQEWGQSLAHAQWGLVGAGAIQPDNE